MEQLKIADLSGQEIDVLMNSIDYDSDGSIRYKEFLRKLSRHGVKSRTPEEQILYLLIEALKKIKFKSLAEAFELFDKKRTGSISRDDFKDVFSNLKGLRVDENEIDRFIDHFWRDQKAGIDYEAFLRVFQRYQLRLDEDESRERKAAALFRVPDDVIRLKKRVYDKINDSLKLHQKTIEGLYRRVDTDGSNAIDVHEFKTLFQNMKIDVTDSELQNIFRSIDFDLSG